MPSAGVTQLARVTAFQAVGRGFEPRLPLFYRIVDIVYLDLFVLMGLGFQIVNPITNFHQ
jgi:hypothetical protein